MRLGKSDEVLRKELSGASAHHKMGLADAEQIAEMCREAGSPEAHALGTVVTCSVIGTGVVLSVAGEAIAFVPNALGRALLHNERL